MSIWARLKTFAGGRSPLPSLASAASLQIPSETNAFYITGSTTITALICGPEARTRKVTFVGAASVTCVFTETVGTTTANQMDFGGRGSITMAAKDILELFCDENGVWHIVSYFPASTTTQSVATGTTTTVTSAIAVSDIVTLTGTASVTTLTGGSPSRQRLITFVGGASAAFTLTNTNTPTAGQMYLHGANRTIREQDTIQMLLNTDGTWFMVSTTSV